MVLTIILFPLLAGLIILAQTLLHYNKKWSSTGASSIEAGFESIKANPVQFSSPFLFMAVVFVLFDLELVLIIPMILTLNSYSELLVWGVLFFFFVISLLLEWKMTGLKWQH